MRTIWEMLEEHRKERGAAAAVRPVFQGVEGYDVYNPTAPFSYQGKTMICARVEKRDSEVSQAVFFEEREKDVYHAAEGWDRYDLQDPCITRVLGRYVLGGTEVFPHPEQPGRLCWRTVFYYGTDPAHMERLAEGPEGMKDVRLVELADGRVGIFTRPQGEKGGRGKIGFTIAEDFGGVTAAAMEDAPLLDLFGQEEWGGVNEVHLLPDGRLGVLGHIASGRTKCGITSPWRLCMTPPPEHTPCPGFWRSEENFCRGPANGRIWKTCCSAAELYAGGTRRYYMWASQTVKFNM